MIVKTYNNLSELSGTIDLPDRIFATKWNPDLVHQALQAQLANTRDNLAHAKGRGEVRGGGKKPWRQKGTGRARHGSIRSPIWRGGGVAHGPTKDKIFAVKINKKMKQAAVFSVLSKKLADGDLKVVESLMLSEPKTKLAVKVIYNFSKNALIIPAIDNKNIYRASANIPKIKSIGPKSLNIYDLLRYKNILIEKEAVAIIDNHYHAV